MNNESRNIDNDLVEELLGELSIDVRSNISGVIDDKELAKRATATRDKILDLIDFYNDLEKPSEAPKYKVDIGVKIDFKAATKELMHFESHAANGSRVSCKDCGITYSDWVRKIIQAALPTLLC